MLAPDFLLSTKSVFVLLSAPPVSPRCLSRPKVCHVVSTKGYAREWKVWMSFTSLVWQEETARCGLGLTEVKNRDSQLCENKVWNKAETTGWLSCVMKTKSSASFEKHCDIVYVNVIVYSNVSKYSRICHVAHHPAVTNSSVCISIINDRPSALATFTSHLEGLHVPTEYFIRRRYALCVDLTARWLVLPLLPSSRVTLERLSARTVSHFLVKKFAVAKVSHARFTYQSMNSAHSKNHGRWSISTALQTLIKSSHWAGKISTDINATFNQLLSGVHYSLCMSMAPCWIY